MPIRTKTRCKEQRFYGIFQKEKMSNYLRKSNAKLAHQEVNKRLVTAILLPFQHRTNVIHFHELLASQEGLLSME
jgi:hypothetical protein